MIQSLPSASRQICLKSSDDGQAQPPDVFFAKKKELSGCKPMEQVRQAAVDVVDVEAGDLHRFRQRSEGIDSALELAAPFVKAGH
jgi:hypothetical protein